MKQLTGAFLFKLVILSILMILFLYAGYKRMHGTEIAVWLPILAGFLGIVLATLELFYSELNKLYAGLLFGITLGAILIIIFNSVSSEEAKEMGKYIQPISEGLSYFAISITIFPIIIRDFSKFVSRKNVQLERQNKLNKVRNELYNKKLSYNDVEDIMKKVDNL
ncbi:hypothetical protein Q0O28_26330 [Bacillus thuringiensis]|uniref:hypothetical protein n=1 Tax=Bacillus thuringiensis TaxID=1428 RepID=UPI00345832A8